MDRTRDGFLAGARFANDEDGEPVASRFGGDRERCAEVRSGTDQLLERQWRSELFRDGRKLTRRAAPGGGGGGRFKEPLGCNGAYKEVGSAGTHRVDCNRDRVAVREDDDRQVGP